MTDLAMRTDRYELTMLDALIRDGRGNRKAVFDLFARKLPQGRTYGVVAGTNRFLETLTGQGVDSFSFSREDIRWIRENMDLSDETISFLTNFEFTGTIYGYPEGSLYLPNSPILTITGTLAECIVLETLALSIMNHDSAIASAAARMVSAAGGRRLIEMGTRRTHETAAIATARAARLVGFDSTSNLAAGVEYNVPTTGTSAHAFTLTYETEIEAFTSQILAMGVDTTLLVDTYDIDQGVRNAVKVANTFGAPGPGAVRIDSGDLAVESICVRRLLDELGATDTQIVVTSDLDEFEIKRLADSPIDAYGVGTRLVTGSGHPTAGMVYKLVAIEGENGGLRSVEKKSVGKRSHGGFKNVTRHYDEAGFLTGEQIDSNLDGTLADGSFNRVLFDDGRVVTEQNFDKMMAWHRMEMGTVPPELLTIERGITTRTFESVAGDKVGGRR